MSEYLGRLVQPEPHTCLLVLPRNTHHDAVAGDVRRCTCGAIWAFGFWGKTHLSWRRLSSWRAWQARRLLRKQSIRAASQTSTDVNALPDASLSAPTAQKGTPDLAAPGSDNAAGVAGTTGPTS